MKNVREHFGYEPIPLDGRINEGIWPRENIGKKLAMLPEFWEQYNQGGKQKVRLIIDYDPDFPEVLFQAIRLRKYGGEKTCRLKKDVGEQCMICALELLKKRTTPTAATVEMVRKLVAVSTSLADSDFS